jgi:hypothetical protein
MKYFINFAANGFYNSQKESLDIAKKFGFNVYGYNMANLDDEFKNKNQHILKHSRGAGYWLWKPYIILDMLNKINDGDYLIYMDSGCKLLESPNQYLDMINSKGILAFSMVQKTSKWTKGDCFFKINDGEDKYKYADTNQVQGTYIFFKKCLYAVDFVKKWLEYCSMENIITDLPNKKLENLPDFIEHRHDQSIFSLLAYKSDIQIIPQIDQYCIEHGYDISRQIIDRHGNRN